MLNLIRFVENLGVQWYAKGLYCSRRKPGTILAKELYRLKWGIWLTTVYSMEISLQLQKTLRTVYRIPCFHVDMNKGDRKILHLYLARKNMAEILKE